jgi:hypothetical protein
MTLKKLERRIDPAPNFIWLDNNRILFVQPGPGQLSGRMPKAVKDAPDPVAILTLLELFSRKTSDILIFPPWQRTQSHPILKGIEPDRMPRVVLGQLGQYRIDIGRGQLNEDDSLRGNYRLSQGRPPERLFFGKTVLAEADRLDYISIAPDSQRIFWMVHKDFTTESRTNRSC